MQRLTGRILVLAVSVAALFVAVTEWQPSAQSQADINVVSITATTEPTLRDWDARINRMLRNGELTLQRVLQDTLILGRQHERLVQTHRGIPVFGGDVVRQLDGSLTVSIFGTIYLGIELDPMPRLSVNEAAVTIRQLAKLAGPEAALPGLPSLTVLPRGPNGSALAYVVQAVFPGDERIYFIDANSGALLFDYSNRQRQAAVGRGVGVLGDTKKVSASGSCQ
jgi:Zn-dependent metalloprotease